MSTALSVRLPEEVSASLDAFVAEQPLNRSAIVTRALDEWVRLQRHPGIRFVTLATGDRVAALEHGPEVWTVAEAWTLADPAERSVDALTTVTGLSRAEVETALRYYADYQAEIDGQLERHWRAQEAERAAWERLRGLHAD